MSLRNWQKGACPLCGHPGWLLVSNAEACIPGNGASRGQPVECVTRPCSTAHVFDRADTQSNWALSQKRSRLAVCNLCWIHSSKLVWNIYLLTSSNVWLAIHHRNFALHQPSHAAEKGLATDGSVSTTRPLCCTRICIRYLIQLKTVDSHRCPCLVLSATLGSS